VGEVFGVDVTQGGAVALLAIVVLMVLTGRLIPRRTYDDMREERNMWRTAAHDAEQLTRKQQDQIDEMLELSRTAGHVLTSLPGQGVGGDPMDHAHAPQG